MRKFASPLGASLVAIAMAVPFTPAFAQEAPQQQSEASADSGEDLGAIVVTARRRDETLISAPVSVTAVGRGELERRDIVRLENLVAAVPQLIIADVGANAQGGIVLIRGNGAGESNPFADQAVSFNVDGLQVSRANIRRTAEVDMQQVEVLKGPQALYFGKNSPGGIIVIKTADPGDRFEAGLNGGYEFNADEYRLDGFVSGPVTDSLGVRLAAFRSDMQGYFRNVATPSVLYGPSRVRVPHDRDWGGRLTLKFAPSSNFDARLKINHSETKSSGGEASVQTIDCPYGTSQTAPAVDDCTANDTVVRADPGALLASFDPALRAQSYGSQKQSFGSLEMNWRPGSEITVTSLTGYYDVRYQFTSTPTTADTALPNLIFGSALQLYSKEFMQELRIASDFSGPFNFMVGGFYQSSRMHHMAATLINAASPSFITPHQDNYQQGDAYSAFLQASYKITPELELSGGGRYSYEQKDFQRYDGAGNLVATVPDHRSWEDFSPEATLTWRPSSNFTLYGAYKHGFLSGGFSPVTGGAGGDRSYDQQKTHGLELGAKGLALDGKLRATFVLYRYDTAGLQVNANVVPPGGTAPLQVVLNAGKARSQGFEAELAYRASSAFEFHSAVGYNRSRYLEFIAPCYAGQTIALGCDQKQLPSGVFSGQDLSGQQVARAPDWNIQGGFSYTYPIGEDALVLSADAVYSSGFYTQVQNKPAGYQKEYATLDAGLTYRNEGGNWSLGLIGKNLTNRYLFFRSFDSVLTGSGTGTSSAAARRSDTNAAIGRGRQIVVRFSARM